MLSWATTRRWLAPPAYPAADSGPLVQHCFKAFIGTVAGHAAPMKGALAISGVSAIGVSGLIAAAQCAAQSVRERLCKSQESL